MKEIINLLKKYTDGKQNTEKVEISVLQLNRVIKALEQQSQKWISIEERYPEKYENVLVKDIDENMTCARIWKDPCGSMVFCEFFSGEPIDDVIEWRRIPE